MLIRKKKDGSLSVSQSENLSRCAEYFVDTLNAAENGDRNNYYEPQCTKNQEVLIELDKEENN